jgi:ArsR family transcriptional regulator
VSDVIESSRSSLAVPDLGGIDSAPRRAGADNVALVAGSLLDLFRVLGDATRLRILALVDTMELAVGEIAQLLDQSQPRVSRHVRLLEEVGLVERRREGSWVFVRRMNDGPGALALTALRGLSPNPCEQAAMAADQRRLSAIQAERDAAARRFFDAHAHEWDAIRSLHVAETEVEQAALRLLDGRRLGHLLDVGTGTGRMVELFAGRAERITALDRSPEMLRLARARLARVGVTADLFQGDFTQLPFTDGYFDSVIMHQVLHYAREPEGVISQLARVMAPGAALMIVDFGPHEREELRREAAHARLGFSDGQMRRWYEGSGLTLEAIETLPGDPLTVKLWLGRRRRSRSPVENLEAKDA